MGRLPSDNPKKNRFEIRLTDEELENIDCNYSVAPTLSEHKGSMIMQ
jgi:hypothetical protein